jgi:CHASE2 domain-containing sensor protein
MSPLASASVPKENALRGKVVILGAAESDDHLTPFGFLSGAEITATAVETELEHGHYAHLGLYSKYTLKIGLALLLAALYHFLKAPFALAATLLLLGAVFAGAFFAFYFASLHVDFVPFLVGIWIEQLYDTAQER